MDQNFNIKFVQQMEKYPERLQIKNLLRKKYNGKSLE
jgi:hypothetical protein